jgi:hypothetical protein
VRGGGVGFLEDIVVAGDAVGSRCVKRFVAGSVDTACKGLFGGVTSNFLFEEWGERGGWKSG